MCPITFVTNIFVDFIQCTHPLHVRWKRLVEGNSLGRQPILWNIIFCASKCAACIDVFVLCMPAIWDVISLCESCMPDNYISHMSFLDDKLYPSHAIGVFAFFPLR